MFVTLLTYIDLILDFCGGGGGRGVSERLGGKVKMLRLSGVQQQKPFRWSHHHSDVWIELDKGRHEAAWYCSLHIRITLTRPRARNFFLPKLTFSPFPLSLSSLFQPASTSSTAATAAAAYY